MTAVPASIFRAYDIRGIVDKTLTPEIAYLVGRAYGSEAMRRNLREVVVGRDGRLSSEAYAHALMEGLIACGCDVIDLGLVPTPVAYFAAHHLGSLSSIVITGSHNPPDYNGIKLMLGGRTLHNEELQHLRARIMDDYFTDGDGDIRPLDVTPDYIRRITDEVRLARPLRVVLDCGNGAGGVVAPRLLEALGCEVEPLYCEVDGCFPNHHPNPSDPCTLAALIDRVTRGGFDVGLAFDGDGDRLGLVDDTGKIIWADRLMMLFAEDILAREPHATIIYDIKSSRHLGRHIRAHGGEPLLWKSGHSFLKAKLEETGAALAGELSGHLFFRDRWYGFDDALYSAARLLEILSRTPRKASEVFAALPEDLSTPELSIPFPHEHAATHFMARFIEHARFNGGTVTTLDGVRVEYLDGWGLARASNTTPTVVIRFEAETLQAMHRIQEDFRRHLLAVDATLTLPF